LDVKKSGLLQFVTLRAAAEQLDVEVATSGRQVDRVGHARYLAARGQFLGKVWLVLTVAGVDGNVPHVVDRRDKDGSQQRAVRLISDRDLQPGRRADRPLIRRERLDPQ